MDRQQRWRAVVLGVIWVTSQITMASNAVAGGAQDVRGAVQALMPATVAIEVHSEAKEDSGGGTSTPPQSDATDTQPANGQPKPDTSGGVSYTSGTIVSTEGLVVTAHVPRDAKKLSVTLSDGRTIPGKIAVVDERTDLVLIKVHADELHPVKLSESPAEIGQLVVTVMSTDVEDRAAATGIVSAKERTIDERFRDLLQTDIAAGTMSAGAPLGNAAGELLGILVASQDSEKPAGISFAVPANYVATLIKSVDRQPVVITRGLLGVQLDNENKQSAIVTQVIDGSGAAKAGLQVGDVIATLNAEAIKSATGLVGAVSKRRAGETVNVGVVRDGALVKLDVILTEAPKRQSFEWKATTVQPAWIYLWDKDGKFVPGQPLPVDATINPKVVGNAYDILLQNRADWTPRTVKVERTDVQEELNRVSAKVDSLQRDVRELTDQLKRLTDQLAKQQKPSND